MCVRSVVTLWFHQSSCYWDKDNRVRLLVRGFVKFQCAVAKPVWTGFAWTFHLTMYQKPCAIALFTSLVVYAKCFICQNDSAVEQSKRVLLETMETMLFGRDQGALLRPPKHHTFHHLM